MPKIVDHEKRKYKISEAAWRVIINQGMEGATVRNIAKEANLSLGALRHYFSTQDELLLYAMNLVKERATARIEKILMKDLPPKEKVLRILMEIVPTNDETKAEMEVWFAFVFHFRHKKDPSIFQLDGILEAMKKLIFFLDYSELLKEEVNKEVEALKLHALIDGLAMHALLDPERMNSRSLEKVLQHYLNSIIK